MPRGQKDTYLHRDGDVAHVQLHWLTVNAEFVFKERTNVSNC